MIGRELEHWLSYAVLGRPPRRRSRRRRRGPARSWRYRAWIRSLACLVCGRVPSHAAHTGHDGGMRMKASDYSCVPLCAAHHFEYDADRWRFEQVHGIRMVDVVRKFNQEWRLRNAADEKETQGRG